jgi:hypothetical protein
MTDEYLLSPPGIVVWCFHRLNQVNTGGLVLMKNRRVVLSLAFFVFFSLCSTPNTHASMIMTVEQQGLNVVASASGTLDLSALTGHGSSGTGGLVWGTYPPGGSAIGVGALTNDAAYGGMLTGSSTTFGSGTLKLANSATGDSLAFAPGASLAQIYVPTGYLSGDFLSGTATWNNTTLSKLGLTPGTYTYSWGSGATADSFTLDIGASPVPEPNLLGCLMLPAAWLAFSRLRRHA